jgi:hypothetical protein
MNATNKVRALIPREGTPIERSGMLGAVLPFHDFDQGRVPASDMAIISWYCARDLRRRQEQLSSMLG